MTKERAQEIWNKVYAKYEATYISMFGQAMWDSLSQEKREKGMRMILKDIALALCETDEEREEIKNKYKIA